MSKFMQIDIRILPFFEKSFEKSFPKITDMLKALSFAEILKKEVSFYALVNTIQTIMEHPDTPAQGKADIAPVIKELCRLKEVAREYLLARKLNDLDKVLYQIEDQFEDLESSL